MEQQLLPAHNMDEPDAVRRRPARSPSFLRSLRLRGGANVEDLGFLVVLPVVVFLLIILVLFLSALGPNEYGIKVNLLSGFVKEGVYHGGLFLTGPVVGFIKFPAAQLTLEYSANSAHSGPIITRTGKDKHDPDSGGQPIAISCSFQYSFVKESLHEVYLNFGGYEGAKERYLLLAGNKVSNMAQRFNPEDFWKKRDIIAQDMLHEINQTLWTYGQAVAHNFQIIKIDFAGKFENQITMTQVAEQTKVINENDQKVMVVVQQINVLDSENQASISYIAAHADRTAKELRANSTSKAFHLKQNNKAEASVKFKEELDLEPGQMMEYLKIRAFVGQKRRGKVTVSMPPVGMPSVQHRPEL